MTSLADIALTIDRTGVGALDRPTIEAVLLLAESANASPVLREVFADDGEPAAVRARAFGRLTMQIGSGRPRFDFTLAA